MKEPKGKTSNGDNQVVSAKQKTQKAKVSGTAANGAKSGSSVRSGTKRVRAGRKAANGVQAQQGRRSHVARTAHKPQAKRYVRKPQVIYVTGYEKATIWDYFALAVAGIVLVIMGWIAAVVLL